MSGQYRSKPDRIGPYRILAQIGEGGFGVVYEAEQASPVRRRVALKIIKPGMDSDAVVSRFEAERQALAIMDHPCIAKVLDAGTTAPDQGSRLYFVMELVRGDPITTVCDTQNLGVEQRVELFIKVCEAVQHAHSKGVVHRDLKPSNILVTYDSEGRAHPKVIDFGVAKALNQPLTQRTVFTERGQLVGTLEYMSPEQTNHSGFDIDTRADVYSLGVLLYELMTGTLPFDTRSLREAGFDEIRRVIREVEPPRPSTRLRMLVSAEADPGLAPRITSARNTDARTLTGLLQRDLDWVVMRCLEKDRERRYRTASALADDLGRFLLGDPVSAGPPTVRYRLDKAIQRHKLPITAALVLLGLAVCVFAWQTRTSYSNFNTGNARFTALAYGNFLLGVAATNVEARALDPPSSASEARQHQTIRDLVELRRFVAAQTDFRYTAVVSDDQLIASIFMEPIPTAWEEQMRATHGAKGVYDQERIPSDEYTALIESWSPDQWKVRTEGMGEKILSEIVWARRVLRSAEYDSWADWADWKPRIFINEAEAQRVLVPRLARIGVTVPPEHSSYNVREPAPELSGPSDNLMRTLLRTNASSLSVTDSVGLVNELESLAYPNGDKAWIMRWWSFAAPTGLALLLVTVSQIGARSMLRAVAYMLSLFGLFLLTYHQTKMLIFVATDLSVISWAIVWLVGFATAMSLGMLLHQRWRFAAFLPIVAGILLAFSRPIWIDWPIYEWLWEIASYLP